MSTRRLAIAFLALGLTTLTGPLSPATAAPAAPKDHIDVIQVGGLIDPINADFITSSIARAERDGAVALVVQLDSPGGVISQARLDALARRITGSKVPIAIWVGGSGTPRAQGLAASLLPPADVVGLGTHAQVVPGVLARAAKTISAPTLGDFIVGLDGLRVRGRVLDTATVVRKAGSQPRRIPNVVGNFDKPNLIARLLHAVAAPSAAYLLLVAGLLLVVFEFYSAGIGIAATTGAACLVLAAYGLGVLPLRPWALGLVLVGVLGYSIDVQAGAPRVWTVVGTVSLVIGSVRLYEGLHASLLIMAVAIGGTALFMVSAMPSMLRTRFATPTIGRESMIGELGVATSAMAPEGTVEVRGAPWRARTNRSTPIAMGGAVRVVGIDGLLLEVEPEVGGARDYRH